MSISWDLYRSLHAVLQEGSLSGAARLLNTSQPTIGRHIDELEKALNHRLFTRSKNGLAPTEVCLALADQVQGISDLTKNMARLVSNQSDDYSGTVRITTSDVIGIEVLPIAIRHIQQIHPKLKIELSLTDKTQNLLTREADIAVRLYRPKQVQLVAQHICNIELGLFATATYLASEGVPSNLADLKACKLIGFDTESGFVRDLRERFQVPLDRDDFSIRTDNNLAQFHYLLASAGIGFCQAPLQQFYPQLRRVLKQQIALEMPVWLTMHEDLRHIPAINFVYKALAEHFMLYRDQKLTK